MNGRMEGKGTFRFPNGNFYVGQMLDGRFHGHGVIHFPDGGMYIATWQHGKEIDGQYIFADALFYKDTKWSYCVPNGNRSFHSERVMIPPAGSTRFANHVSSSDIPSGCYDVAYGYYVPEEGAVCTYAGERIRSVSDEEAGWIVAYCQKY